MEWINEVILPKVSAPQNGMIERALLNDILISKEMFSLWICNPYAKKKKVCEVFMESFNNRKLCKYLLFIMCVTKEEVVELTNKRIEYPVLFFFILFSFVLIIFSLFSLFLSICLCCNLDGYILAVIETSTWGHREGEVLWDLDQFGARN